ncbi:MAG: hypothetical protein AMXMBFR56_30960 [Polyangiaceae bacterium]
MTRLVSFSAVCVAFVSLTACSADDGGSSLRQAYKVDPAAKCDPADTNCAGEDPTVPPCDPADTNCKPPPPVSNPCDAQAVKSDESCKTLLGYTWNGSTCTELHGCQCFGPDCGSLFKSAEACKEAFGSCVVPDWCGETAQELATLLAEARSCNIASAGAIVCDGTVVPTTMGCPVPVASGSSKATIAYLDLYKAYAQKCPLPVPACPSPKGLSIDCVQGADIDGLMGACSYVPAPSTGEAK